MRFWDFHHLLEPQGCHSRSQSVIFSKPNIGVNQCLWLYFLKIGDIYLRITILSKQFDLRFDWPRLLIPKPFRFDWSRSLIPKPHRIFWPHSIIPKAFEIVWHRSHSKIIRNWLTTLTHFIPKPFEINWLCSVILKELIGIINCFSVFIKVIINCLIKLLRFEKSCIHNTIPNMFDRIWALFYMLNVS